MKKKIIKKKKAKKIVKRINKKQTKVRPAQQTSETTAIVPVNPLTQKDLGPEKDGGKYMIPKSWVSERQVLALVNKTNPKYILKRPGKGGAEWSYAPGWYFVKALNFAFGWNWDYEKVQEPTVMEVISLISAQIDQLWVTGKLTVKDNDGHSITKTQVGRADIKFKKGTRIPLDIGNDLKAAHTDCLKKCASLLGIASDIYGKNESKEEGYTVVEDTDKQVHAKEEAVVVENGKIRIDYECVECAQPITKAEAEFSTKIYGKALCRADQKNNKK